MFLKFINSRSLLFVLLVATTNLQAQGLVSDDQERSALLALYNATAGGNWVKTWRLSQISSYPDSLPYGVSIANGDIIEIELDGNRLEGNLPHELNKLKALQILSLSANKLSGSIPVLDSLVNLKTLNLGNHYFTGPFPSWIGKLSVLQTLNLASNPSDPSQLEGPIPNSIQNLAYLGWLYLSNNDFSSALDIPDEFSSLDNLLYLDLEGCQLTPASVNSGLSGLANLNQLNLSRNASYVESTGIFPSDLINLPNLRYVYLRGNGFNEFPASFSSLTNLYYLDLSQNNYSDTTRLSSSIDVLKSIPSLKYLDLSTCQIVRLPSDFNELIIEALLLSNNPLEPEQCNDLGDMPNLKTLYINSCSLESIPSNLSTSSSLQNLYAWYNNLNPVPEEIKEIPNLQTLELGSNGIAALPEWFGTGNMGTLRRLVLSSNQLVTVPDNFTELTNLRELVIANNHLNGTWPIDFDSLRLITMLDLRNNQIDSIPDLTNWTSLESVYLQNNILHGEVPAFLSNKTSNKLNVNISFNQYSSISNTSNFNGTSPTITVNNNQFTFEDILQFKPTIGKYIYSPQPQIDVVHDIFSYPGSSFRLIAAIDTALTTSNKAQFRWFKYIDGVNDSALSAAPSAQAFNFVVANTFLSDEGEKYYYKITHPDAPNLTLVSKLQTLVFTCKGFLTALDFDANRYLCALNFKPFADYTSECRTLNYEWNFGDGFTSAEKSPWHAYENEGTYSVSLKMSFVCGACQSDSTITKQISYALPDQFVVDSLVSVHTSVKEEILSVAASTFSDSWPLQHPTETLNINSYLNGEQGVWRNNAAYVYNVTRGKSVETNIAKDGTFTLEQFNWSSPEVEAIPDWIKANAITSYSPFSFELENRDVLGIHTAALYDYGGHLPSANGVNMRNDEMAYTGFEMLENKSSGNLVFGNQPLPEYYLYNVKSAKNHIAVIEAPIDQLSNVAKVDVSARGSSSLLSTTSRGSNFIQDDPILCIQNHPTVPTWSMIVLKREPFSGIWTGQIKVKNDLQPIIDPSIDSTYAHTGKSSLKITSETTFEQRLLRLDSGKTYFINAWVSVHNPYITTPKLGSNLGMEIVFKDRNNKVLALKSFEPSGPVIEGWQQVRGTVTCPDNLTVVSLRFKAGSTGAAWYDDLRIHPENGNMKSYVYGLSDYRLRAILDEENFATLYYYDDEGNLYLVKKETERGIKTISENMSYQIKNNEVGN